MTQATSPRKITLFRQAPPTPFNDANNKEYSDARALIVSAAKEAGIKPFAYPKFDLAFVDLNIKPAIEDCTAFVTHMQKGGLLAISTPMTTLADSITMSEELIASCLELKRIGVTHHKTGPRTHWV